MSCEGEEKWRQLSEEGRKNEGDEQKNGQTYKYKRTMNKCWKTSHREKCVEKMKREYDVIK